MTKCRDWNSKLKYLNRPQQLAPQRKYDVKWLKKRHLRKSFSRVLNRFNVKALKLFILLSRLNTKWARNAPYVRAPHHMFPGRLPAVSWYCCLATPIGVKPQDEPQYGREQSCEVGGASSVTSQKIWEGPKNWEGKMFDFWRITLFCLGYRLSKHKMTTWEHGWRCNFWVRSSNAVEWIHSKKTTESCCYVQTKIYNMTDKIWLSDKRWKD